MLGAKVRDRLDPNASPAPRVAQPTSQRVGPLAGTLLAIVLIMTGLGLVSPAAAGATIPTTLTLASSVPSTVFGQRTTLTATVRAGAAVPSGVVTFADGATVLGSATLFFGTYSLVVGTLAVGSHQVTATFAGGGYGESSAGITQVVATASTTVSLTSSAPAAAFGQTVTFAAALAPTAPGSGTPSGPVTFSEGSTTLGTGTLSQGKYVWQTGALAVGLHQITAASAGSESFSAGRATITQTVAAATTTLTLSSSANPAVATQAVTLTAVVSPVAPGAGAPGGTVTFTEGSTTLGTAGYWFGRYSVSLPSLSVGPHQITATFGGTASFGASSATLTQTVGVGATATTAVASANPTVLGQSVDLYATVAAVAPATGTPSGTVTFTEGGVVRGTATLYFNRYTLRLPSLALGSHQITASYSGNATFAASATQYTIEVVLPRPTLAVVSSVPTSVAGQPVVLDVTLAGTSASAATPTGTVAASEGGAPLGSAVLGAGRASIALPALPVGVHLITVTYGGDGNYQPSTTSTTQTVNPAAASLGVTSSIDPSVTGQPVVLTATVVTTAPGRAIATGSVLFAEQGASIGTAVLDATGTARWTGALGSVGDHTITVSYAGDGQVAATSGAFVGHVTPASSTVALGTSARPAIVGQTVVITATVAADAPGSGTPNGTVTFAEGEIVLGTQTLVAGTASLPVGPLEAGDHLISARYSGDASFLAGIGSFVQAVSRASAVGTAAASVNPSVYGAPASLSVAVAASTGSGTPTGPVTVSEGGRVLAAASLDAGVVTIGLPELDVGDHALSIDYAGDARFLPTSFVVVQRVTGAAATITGGSASGPVVFGAPMTFSILVAAAAVPGTPTGLVAFREGTADLGTVALAAGSATFAPPPLAVGVHTITAAYLGDAAYAGSTISFDQLVNPASSALVLTSSVDAASFGQPVVLTATVGARAPGAGIPSGSVTFRDATTQLGSASVDSAGVARLSMADLAVGEHALTAAYAGDASFGGADGTHLVIVTTGAAVVNVSPRSSTVTGQPIGVGAAVTPLAPSVVTPTGAVTFSEGPQILGSTNVTGDGSLSIVLPGLPAGLHRLTASYGGPGFADAAVTFDHEVRPASSLTSVASSASQPVAGHAVTFTAPISVLAPAVGTPTGTVQFTDGASPMGTADLIDGVAAWTSSDLTVGPHQVTATYVGSAVMTGSSATVTVTVRAETVVTVTSSSNPTTYGASFTLGAQVAPLLAPALPTGTVTFAEGSLKIATAPLVNGTASVVVVGGWAVGRHDVTVSYGGDPGSLASSGALTVTVDPAPTVVKVGTDAQPAVYGQNGTIWAVVSTPAGVVPGIGTVTFADETGTLGVASLFFGRYAIRLSSLSVGTHTVTARYAGTANYAASTTGMSQTISPAVTTISVTSTANPTVATSAATLQATVTTNAPGGAPPIGPVTFREGTVVLATVATPFFGRYGLPVGSLAVGSHVIVASFAGSPGYLPSSATVTQTVNSAATSVTLASTVNPAGVFSDGSLQATVAAVAPALGSPTGSVTFTEGAAVLGTPTLYFNRYSLSLSDLAIGTHVITATFTGTGAFTGSSNAFTQIIVKATPRLVLTTSTNPSQTRDGSYLSVSLTSAAGTIHDMPGPQGQGTVTFFDSGTPLTTVSVDGDRAYLSYFTLPEGIHPFTVTYSGNDYFLPATSAALVQTINVPSVTAAAAPADPTCAAAVGIGDSRLMNTGLWGRAAQIATGADSPLGNTAILALAPKLQAIMGYRYGTFGHREFIKAQKARCSTPRHYFTLLGPNHTLFPTYLIGDTQAWDATDSAELSGMLDLMTGDDAYGPGGSVVVGSFVFGPTAPALGRAAAAAHDQAVLDYIASHPTRTVKLLTLDPTTIAWAGGDDWIHPTSPTGAKAAPTGQDELARQLFTGLAAFAPDLAAPVTTTTLIAPSSAESGTTVILTATVVAVPPATGPLAGSVSFFDGSTLIASWPLANGFDVTSSTASLGEGSHRLTARFTSAGGSQSSVSAVADLTITAPIPTPSP